MECVYSRLHSSTKVVSLWFYRMDGRLVWIPPKTIKALECDLTRSGKPSRNMSMSCRGESWKQMCLPVSHVRSSTHTDVLYHSKPPLSRTLLRSNTYVEKTESCTAEVMYTEYQSTAPALEHEWWFSRSTFRWEEQEVSAGWFSASISYKRGHFSPHRMTYEGTAAAFISILLWGMVAKVSLYLL